MYEVEVDKSRNVLKIVFSQQIGPAEVNACEQKVRTLLANFQPGFRLLSDFSNLEFMDVACAPSIERVMDLCNRHGVSKVVRVIPDRHKDIGLNIMSLFHYRRRIAIVTCETMIEAVKELEG
jgi:anti-anti-sigma regulatory factor